MSRSAGSSRSVLWWLVIALLSSGLTLLLILPAAWVAPLFAQATGQRLTLRDTEGSVWKGSGQLWLGSPDFGGEVSGPRALPGRLAWRAAIVPLLSGRVQMELSEPGLLERPVELTVERRHIHIGSGRLSLDLAILGALGAPFNTLAFTGRAQCEWGPWELEHDAAAGHGEVQLVDIASPLSAVRPLGSYALRVDGKGELLDLVLTTARGPLLLNAQGSVNQRGMAVRGQARAEPGAEDRLADLLGVLGRREDGAVQFSFGILN